MTPWCFWPWGTVGTTSESSEFLTCDVSRLWTSFPDAQLHMELSALIGYAPERFKSQFHFIDVCLGDINSVQTRCIVKGEAQKSPLFWRFSGGF